MKNYAVMPLTDYTNICDKVREKTATTENIKSGDVPDKIEDVYNAGQKAEYDRFWDTYQNYGERNSCEGTFMGYGWNEVTLKPKYDIKPSTAYMMFAYCGYTGDLDEVFKNRNVNLDFSKCGNMQYTFLQSKISVLGNIDCSGVTYADAIVSAFTSTNIHTIKNFTPPRCKMSATNWQSGLVNIGISGEIVEDLGMSRCTKLTHDSLMSIINGLKDYYTVVEKTYNSGYFSFPPVSGVVSVGTKYEITSINGSGIDFIGNDSAPWGFAIIDSTFPIEEVENATHFAVTYDAEVIFFVPSAPTETYTLTLGTTNLAKLTDSEKAIATEKGWTLA